MGKNVCISVCGKLDVGKDLLYIHKQLEYAWTGGFDRCQLCIKVCMNPSLMAWDGQKIK